MGAWRLSEENSPVHQHRRFDHVGDCEPQRVEQHHVEPTRHVGCGRWGGYLGVGQVQGWDQVAGCLPGVPATQSTLFTTHYLAKACSLGGLVA